MVSLGGAWYRSQEGAGRESLGNGCDGSVLSSISFGGSQTQLYVLSLETSPSSLMAGTDLVLGRRIDLPLLSRGCG